MRHTSTYRTWYAMKERCYNPRNNRYHLYGQRGIGVCEQWRDSFICFLTDMGERPKGATLDRISAAGSYAPGNCRWATMREQCNNKRDNRVVTHNGKTQSITQWVREIAPKNLQIDLVFSRIGRLGWDPVRAITTPPRKLVRKQAST